jgi:hypothetical protein
MNAAIRTLFSNALPTARSIGKEPQVKALQNYVEKVGHINNALEDALRQLGQGITDAEVLRALGVEASFVLPLALYEC